MVSIKRLAPCNKGIRIPESGKFLLVESGILDFKMRNTAQRIRNLTNDSNLELGSTDKDWNVVAGLESTPWNQEFRNVLDSLITWGEEVK